MLSDAWNIFLFQQVFSCREVSERIAGSVKPSWQGNEYAVSIVFALITSIVKTIEGIPWSLYSTFVIEERHGFNKQTLSLFFADMVKSVRSHSAQWPEPAGSL